MTADARPPLPTVLVVDDSPENLHVVGALLSTDYRVLVASKGAQGIELAQRDPRPDLVLLDVMMPGMDGYTVLASLLENPATRNIPVVFLTALNAHEDEARGLRAGAVDYVTKPVQPEILLARVRSQVELHRARQALQRQNAELEMRVAERTQALQQALQAAEAAAEAKAEFLANIGHELRTPMNGTLGMLSLLLDAGLSEDQRSLAAVAHESASALMKVLNDILEFADADAGKITVAAVPFDPAALLQHLRGFFDTQARDKRLTLDLTADPTLPATVIGDAAHVRQILVKLLDNALKFTAAGRVSLHVGVSECSAETVRLRFDIADAGIGIAPELAKTLFQPFSQADGSMTRKFGGVGLGLAIAHRITKLLNGTIAYLPRAEGGSLFRVELPFALT